MPSRIVAEDASSDIIGAWAERGDGMLVLGVRCYACDAIRTLSAGLAWAFRARRDAEGRSAALELELLAEARRDPQFTGCVHLAVDVTFDRSQLTIQPNC